MGDGVRVVSALQLDIDGGVILVSALRLGHHWWCRIVECAACWETNERQIWNLSRTNRHCPCKVKQPLGKFQL